MFKKKHNSTITTTTTTALAVARTTTTTVAYRCWYCYHKDLLLHTSLLNYFNGDKKNGSCDHHNDCCDGLS